MTRWCDGSGLHIAFSQALIAVDARCMPSYLVFTRIVSTSVEHPALYRTVELQCPIRSIVMSCVTSVPTI
jgi:hypothetical protein